MKREVFLLSLIVYPVAMWAIALLGSYAVAWKTGFLLHGQPYAIWDYVSLTVPVAILALISGAVTYFVLTALAKK